MLYPILGAQQKPLQIQRLTQLPEPGYPGRQENYVILMQPQPGQSQSPCMLACQWNMPEHWSHAVLHKILEHKQSRLPGKGLVTSVDVCKGSFHIYRTVGELGASEGLLKLDHAAYGLPAAQGSASPVFTLGSSSCLQQGIGMSLKPSYQMFDNSPRMSNEVPISRYTIYKYNKP